MSLTRLALYLQAIDIDLFGLTEELHWPWQSPWPSSLSEFFRGQRTVQSFYYKPQQARVIRRAARCIAAGQRWRGSNTR